MRNLLYTAILGIALCLPPILLSQVSGVWAWRQQAVGAVTFINQIDGSVRQVDYPGMFATYIRPPFNSKLDYSTLSTEDILHMQDVQVLFQTLWVALGLFIILFMASGTAVYRSGKPLKEVFTRTGRFWLGVSVVIGIAALLFWNQVFLMFHRFVFPANNYWQLDPGTSFLVRAYPEILFKEAAIAWGVGSIILFWGLITAYNRLISRASARM